MNTIGEKIDLKKAGCREMYVPDLKGVLNSSIITVISWGAKDFTVDGKKPKWFRMTVKGRHHKGFVYICLNGLDLFDVYLTDVEDIIKDRTEDMGIYVMDLIEWIDKKIEWIPEYSR